MNSPRPCTITETSSSIPDTSWRQIEDHDLSTVRDLRRLLQDSKISNSYLPVTYVKTRRNQKIILITCPRIFKAILEFERGVDSSSFFVGATNSSHAKTILGECLLTASPIEHEKLKRMVQPVFSGSLVSDFAKKSFEIAFQHMQRMFDAADGKPIFLTPFILNSSWIRYSNLPLAPAITFRYF